MSDDRETKIPKVRAPNVFDGTRSNLKKFLMQCDIYFKLCEGDFEEESQKALFIAGCITDSASDWVEPYMRDYLDNPTTNQRMDTQVMFSDYDAMKQSLHNMFGDSGEDRRAATMLMASQQGNSVTQYAAQFQQLLAKVG
jgi:Retrotransposon gag protein